MKLASKQQRLFEQDCRTADAQCYVKSISYLKIFADDSNPPLLWRVVTLKTKQTRSTRIFQHIHIRLESKIELLSFPKIL